MPIIEFFNKPRLNFKLFFIGVIIGLAQIGSGFNAAGDEVLTLAKLPPLEKLTPFSRVLPDFQPLAKINPLERIRPPYRPSPTATPYLFPSDTPTPQFPTSTPEPSLTSTPEPSSTATPIPSATLTSTPIPTVTVTVAPSPTSEITPTESPEVSSTPTITPEAEPSITVTPSPSSTPEPSPTSEPLLTPTTTPTSEPPGPGGNYGLRFNGGQTVRVEDSVSLDSLTTEATWEYWLSPGFPDLYFSGVLTKSVYNQDGTWAWEAGEYNGSFHKGYIFSGTTSFQDPIVWLQYPGSEWQHVAWVFQSNGENSTLEFYLNGNLIQTNNLPITELRTNNKPLIIGDFPNLNRFLYGVLDEVRIWNIAKTENEIRQNMIIQLSGSEPGLIAYWNFNEGSGLSLYDATSNNNTGFLQGDPLPEWVSGVSFPIQNTSQVLINEFMPDPDDDDDWVELYNPSSASKDISGWYLSDGVSNYHTFSSGTSLESFGYLSVGAYRKFNNDGDSIYLFDSDANPVDYIYYTSGQVSPNQSIGRYPDGANNWKSCTTSSRDSSNSGC